METKSYLSPIHMFRGGHKLHNGKVSLLLCLLVSLFLFAVTACKHDPEKVSLKPTVYTVTFDTDGGSEVASQTVEENGKAIKPETDPTKENCTFLGWYLSKTSPHPYDFDTEITKDITLYARWEAAHGFFKVIFITNCDLSIESQTIEEGQKATEPAPAPVRNKYKFAGWYADSVFTRAFDFDTEITQDTTIYAKWIALFTITFSGADVESQTVEADQKAIKPQDPVSSKGYFFGGWYIDEECTIAFDFNTPIVEDKTLYAKWKEGWTVTFSGVSDIPAQTVKNKSKAVRPSKPADHDNLIFDDWYEDAAFTTKFNFDKLITSDTIIYAKWLSTYTVTFNSNGGSEVDPVQVVQGGKVTKPAAPSRGGRTFAGWFTDSECTKAFDFDTATVTRDFTLFAKWDTKNIDNPLSIEIVKAELEVEYEVTSLVGGQKIEFTSKCGEGDWYIDGSKVASFASSYEALSYFYSQSARFVTVEFHKTINGIEYTWQALLSL